jgi:hypothetical protein
LRDAGPRSGSTSGANSEGRCATAAARNPSNAGDSQQSQGASRHQNSLFTRCAKAYRHKTTNPAAGEATSPALFTHRHKSDPTDLSTPGESSAGRTQNVTHRILSQRRAGTPPRGAELRRAGASVAANRGEASPRTNPTNTTHATTPPPVVFSATRGGARTRMAKKYLSRTPG